ncbi:MAG: DUF302 domain-containing protein [Ferrimicrobium sp.]|jgi:uncharacterized protein (DUF302 family)|uniref:DUF302 domain-containing protein n=1 Tax=Ferrimicrobium acidiphilum TaxID=121039 RepID=A0ABV3XZB1_9ACTN|nr:DUF302 domain-containing protein [Ferrimicrobium sp.]MCL5973684.1 DUF302 domain-containing protein [Actinomycetota bacterium]MDA8399320.1 DUF302 domain-containing protein [Actinomycetota bacterium]
MLSFSVETTHTLPEAEAIVREQLASVGFGILSEIDLGATLAAKLNRSVGNMKILGACNPQFAYDAITSDRSIALLLPCNVVLDATETGTRVSVPAPEALLPGRAEITQPVTALLMQALTAMGTVTSTPPSPA